MQIMGRIRSAGFRSAFAVATLFTAAAVWLYARTGSALTAVLCAAPLTGCLVGAYSMYVKRFPGSFFASWRKGRKIRERLLSLPEQDALILALGAIGGDFAPDKAELSGNLAFFEQSGGRVAVKLCQCHDSQTVNANDVLSFYRALAPFALNHAVMLLLARASGGALACARELSSPDVTLVSSSALTRALSSMTLPEQPDSKVRKKALALRLPGDYGAVRQFWAGFALVCCYLAFGIVWFLAAGLALCAYGCSRNYARRGRIQRL